MNHSLTVNCEFHIAPQRRGRQKIQAGGPAPVPAFPPARVSRVSRLMALAIHFDELIRSGHVRDQATLSRVGHVTRARLTQIMNLLNLAPDIQEAILSLPRTAAGRDPISERELRSIVVELDWRKQRRAWRRLTLPTP